jgi:Na+-transporting methylmalonyl-CoA/oxaloacetate decarboxylase gamma subunit
MGTTSLQNIFTHGGIAISITGMLIVFTGLLIISLYIRLLPKILAFLEKDNLSKKFKSGKKVPPSEPEVEASKVLAKPEKPADDINEIMSVIGIVLHLEQKRVSALEGGDELITITRDYLQPSVWRSTGKMRIQPQRRRRE